jgi:hypothetical protein
MQEWARGEERSCCHRVNQTFAEIARWRRKRNVGNYRCSAQTRRETSYRPLPHRIVVFWKEDINLEGQCVSNYGQQERDRQGLEKN